MADVTDQTERIVKALCDEIKRHNEEYTRGRSPSFVHSVLDRRRSQIRSYPGRDRSESRGSELELSLDSILTFDSSIEFIEAENTEELDEADEEEAIQAIIDAITKMADKIDSDPKMVRIMQKTVPEGSSLTVGRFNQLIHKILDEVNPGLSADTWSNTIFVLIVALKMYRLKHYPVEIFKTYVYDKIVPWVTKQPQGWISARDDEKVGKVVQSVERHAVKTHQPIRAGSAGSRSDHSQISGSPSSLLNWFSIPRSLSSSMSDS